MGPKTDDVIYNEGDGIQLGQWGCDNKIAYILNQSGYEVINPCRKINSFHLHRSNVRNWYNHKRKGGYKKPFLYVKCANSSGL